IVLADQLGRSVGDMYRGAMVPGLLLTGAYIAYVLILAVLRPKDVPPIPAEHRTYSQANGRSGARSLCVLLAISLVSAYLLDEHVVDPNGPIDEKVIIGILLVGGVAFVLALLNKWLKLGMLSTLAERVTFVMIPPLALIFLVLGTIFLGIATPTEGGAMGAVGAILMAVSRRRLSLDLLKQAMDTTAKLSCFVMFILIGSTIFSLTFRGVDGDLWVEHLLI